MRLALEQVRYAVTAGVQIEQYADQPRVVAESVWEFNGHYQHWPSCWRCFPGLAHRHCGCDLVPLVLAWWRL
jgi:hypothetical protein